MSLLREIRLRARPVLVPFIGACLAGYFGYHAIQGDRGVVTWLQLGQRVEQAKAAIAASREVESQPSLVALPIPRPYADWGTRATINNRGG